jgi:hypothetical protein
MRANRGIFADPRPSAMLLGTVEVGVVPVCAEAVTEVATLDATSMETFREVALRHAVNTSGEIVSPEKVVEAAQTYLAFLEAE